jgi:IstB-like ATP binding protein
MAGTLETRLRQAQAEPMAPIDLVASLVTDELHLRGERLMERRRTGCHSARLSRALPRNPRVARRPCGIIDDFGMRKLPLTAAEDWLEIVLRRYERASTLLTSHRPVEDGG